MKAATNKASPKTTEEERRAKKKHEEHVKLVIETYERVIHLFARSGHLARVQELAADMMEMAQGNPEDFGRWKSVAVEVASPPEPPEEPET